ncbi:hypothetical protein DZF81_25345 [Vibrio parahaemolyticus]|nr:hypothetical protein [Vibrio parahaemolyticus]
MVVVTLRCMLRVHTVWGNVVGAAAYFKRMRDRS